ISDSCYCYCYCYLWTKLMTGKRGEVGEDNFTLVYGKKKVFLYLINGKTDGIWTEGRPAQRKVEMRAEMPKNEKLFLLGLDKYGKGDWRSISRNFVVTRNPTQVASHAQKYFIRLNSMNKDRRRSSIHDITSVSSGEVSVPQGPFTDQTNASAVGSSSVKSKKQPPQVPATAPGVGMYGEPTIGHPIGGPLVSAVGMPVNVPPSTHMAYGVQAPIPGPKRQTKMGPMTYPMPHTSANR
ncbi:transcription factor DIVARICATA-like, partial [Olea europaea subsp. europaea]